MRKMSIEVKKIVEIVLERSASESIEFLDLETDENAKIVEFLQRNLVAAQEALEAQQSEDEESESEDEEEYHRSHYLLKKE